VIAEPKKQRSAKHSSVRTADLLLAFSCIVRQSPDDCPESEQTRRKIRDDIDWKGSTRLVLMYFPSLVRSLSEVAFSEPARSIKL